MNDNNTTPAMKEGDTVDFEYHTEQDVITGTGKIIWINNNDCVVETQKGKSKPKRHMMEISALKNTPLPEAQPLEGVKTARDFIKSIQINDSNLKHIANTGIINGTLLIEIERVMQAYHAQFATDAGGEQNDSNVTLLSDCQGLLMELIANNHVADYVCASMNDMISRIDDALSAPSTHSSSEMVEPWISVKDRLPGKYNDTEQSQTVLTACEFGIRLGLCNYFSSKATWRIQGTSGYSDGVTHWMPLPNKPKVS